MKNKRAMAAALAAVLYLTGCAYVTGDTGKTAPKNTTEAETSQSAEETEAAPRMEESVEDAVFSEEEEDEDLYMDLFRSGASVVQMEITTGLTTEYLDPLCNYPVKVYLGGEEKTVEDEEGLKEIGLDALYSDALINAVKDFDTDSIEVTDGRAVMGDDTLYVVLEMDEYENVGITEFHE